MEKPPRDHVIKDSLNLLRRERLQGGCRQREQPFRVTGHGVLGLCRCLCPALGGLSAGGTQELQRLQLLVPHIPPGPAAALLSSSFPGKLLMRSAPGAGMAEERSPVGGFEALALGDGMSEHHLTGTQRTLHSQNSTSIFCSPLEASRVDSGVNNLYRK